MIGLAWYLFGSPIEHWQDWYGLFVLDTMLKAFFGTVWFDWTDWRRRSLRRR